jgi:hypothetical protein
MEFTGNRRDEFIADARSILILQDRRRSAARVLENRMRGLNWKGWHDFGAFVRLCRDLGFHCYDGISKRNQRVHFIAIDPAPPAEPDYFEGIGFVLVSHDGIFVNRSNPPGSSPRRASARVWKTERGVRGFCERKRYDFSLIRHTRDLDNGAA